MYQILRLLLLFLLGAPAFAQTPELIADLNPGSGDGLDKFKKGFAALDLSRAVLTGDDATKGFEPYLVQGKSLTLLKDINPGAAGSDPAFLTSIGDKVYFIASGPEGRRLWVTDGTEAGTKVAANIDTPNHLHAGPNGQLWIQAGGKIYVLKPGSTSPTSITLPAVVEIRDEAVSLGKRILNVGDRVVFTAIGSNDSLQVWAADGAIADAKKVAVFTGGFFGKIYGLLSVGGKVLCAVENSYPAALAAQNGLYALSLTPGEASIKLLGSNNMPKEFYASGGQTAYFYAGGLFVTDGTPTGTLALSGPLSSSLLQGANLPFAQLGTKALFFKKNLFSTDIMVTDGTAAGTQMLKNTGDAFIEQAVRRQGRIFFVSNIDNGFQPAIWTSDLTANGTKSIYRSLENASNGPTLVLLGFLGDYLYYQSNEYSHGRELYRVKVNTGVPTVAPPPVSLSLAPSLAQDLVRIAAADFLQEAGVQIPGVLTDASGRSIPLALDQTTDGWLLNVSSLPAGLYVLHVSTGGKTGVGRFIKL